jgi:hypothetical protein
LIFFTIGFELMKPLLLYIIWFPKLPLTKKKLKGKTANHNINWALSNKRKNFTIEHQSHFNYHKCFPNYVVNSQKLHTPFGSYS